MADPWTGSLCLSTRQSLSSSASVHERWQVGKTKKHSSSGIHGAMTTSKDPVRHAMPASSMGRSLQRALVEEDGLEVSLCSSALFSRVSYTAGPSMTSAAGCIAELTALASCVVTRIGALLCRV